MLINDCQWFITKVYKLRDRMIYTMQFFLKEINYTMVLRISLKTNNIYTNFKHQYFSY